VDVYIEIWVDDTRGIFSERRSWSCSHHERNWAVGSGSENGSVPSAVEVHIHSTQFYYI
jgi:hypothetical protein